MVENKDFILKGIVFVIHKFTDLYFLFFIINEITFDVSATQPNSSGKRHGGGRYGELFCFA